MLVEPLLTSWAKERNTVVKELIEQQLHDEYSVNKEYSSTIKAYLRANGFPVQEN